MLTYCPAAVAVCEELVFTPACYFLPPCSMMSQTATKVEGRAGRMQVAAAALPPGRDTTLTFLMAAAS